MDYKNMSDSELATIMVNQINRTAHLQMIIARYLDGSDHGSIPAENIKNEYRQLKQEICKDADYLDKTKNANGSDLYVYYFRPSIRNAAAFGFTVPVNSAINQKMYSAVEEAHYRLCKYHSLEEWGKLI